MRHFLLALLLATAAHAGTVSVKPDDDLQAAINSAAPGDVVTLAKGTYSGSFTIPLGKNGLVLKGKGAVVLDARPGGEAVGPALVVLSSDVTVQGLTLRHAKAGSSGEGLLAGSRLQPADGLRLIKLSILNCEGAAISVTGDDLYVSGCTLTGNGAGLVVIGDRAQVVKTSAEACDTYGVQVAGNDAVVTGCQVSTTGDSGGGMIVTGSGATVTKSKFQNAGGVSLTVTGGDLTVTKNKVSDGALAGISVNHTGGTSLVDGNTVETCDGAGIVATATNASGLTVSKNKVRHCGRSGSAGYVLATGSAKIEKNTAEDNAHGGFHVAGSTNTLSGNTARRNLTDGFVVLSGSANALDGNKAFDNLGEGFQNGADDDSGAAVTNTALRNANAKGNRRDIGVYKAFQPFDNITFTTGGNAPLNPDDQPEIGD